MNKFIIIIIFAVILVAGGIIYSVYFRAPETAPIKPTGNIVEINVRVPENQWVWDPAVVTVKAGDTVRLKIFNEDAYDHGFALEVFGVNKRLFPKQETTIEFVASKKGDFPFYCSVPCGEGHYKQVGRLIVGE